MVKYGQGIIELFETAFRHLLVNIQNGAKILKPNDWVDYLLFTYVNPSDKFWTNDTALKKVIKDCGMDHYLFEIKIL